MPARLRFRCTINAQSGSQKQSRIGLRRCAKNLLNRAFLHHLAMLHHHHAVANFSDDIEVMRDKDHCTTTRPAQSLDQFQYLRLGSFIERGCGFVQYQ